MIFEPTLFDYDNQTVRAMLNLSAKEALEIILEQSPLGHKSMEQLRKNLEAFYIGFHSKVK